MSEHALAAQRKPTPLWIRTLVVILGTAVAAAVVVPLALQWAGASAVEGVALEAAGISAGQVHTLVRWALSRPGVLAAVALLTGTLLGWLVHDRVHAAPDPTPSALDAELAALSGGPSPEEQVEIAREFLAEVEPLLASLRRAAATAPERDPLDDDALQLPLLGVS